MKKLITFCLIAFNLGAFAQKASHTFALGDSTFMLDSKPLQIISGEMHCYRIPRAYWRDRIRKAKAMGLNTIGTYIFWNMHEPVQGKYDFTGNSDIAEFVRIAKEEGMWVIMRPSPYACAEWEFGGYPWWLLKDKTLKVRSKDPKFLKAYHDYVMQLGKQLNPLLVNLVPATRNLADPRTQLERLVVALGRTSAIVAPAAETQASLFRNLDTTFTSLSAVARPFIQESISEGPPTLRAAIRDLPLQRPFLANSTALFRELRPGARALRTSSGVLADALEVGTPTLRRLPAFNQRLIPTFHALERFADDPLVSLGVQDLTATSNLLSPILMVTQTAAVFQVLFGLDSGWRTQSRDGAGIPFMEALRYHRWHMLIGVVMALACYEASALVLAWMSPVIVGLIFAAPLTWLTSLFHDYEQGGSYYSGPEPASEPETRAMMAFLAEIGGQPLLGLRRLDLRKAHQPLSRAAVASLGRRDDEIAVRDAEIGMAGLRQRRGAIGGVGAGVDVDLLGLRGALHHAFALAGLDAEPAARRRRAFFLQAEREIEHVARLVAELQVGARGCGQADKSRHCRQERPPHRSPANRLRFNR